jgi:proteasome accessory factor B
MHPLERLLNLVALLLETNRPLTFEEIRTTLHAYGQADKASAKRQFERDKDTLRQVGIPVETVPTDAWEVEEGYRIPRERYELPDVSFEPQEVAALFVAAHGEGGEGAQAFRKLALGAERGLLASLEESLPASGVDASGPRLAEVADAVSRRRQVTFRYRPVTGEEGQRHVDAWALLFRSGAWYLVGRDRDRGEPRSFRLSRIASDLRDAGHGHPPPEGFRAAEHLTAGPWGLGKPQAEARVAFSPKVSWWATAGLPKARTLRTRSDGWSEAEVPVGEGFVSWILSFGADAEVLAPPPIRGEVADALEAVRAAV